MIAFMVIAEIHVYYAKSLQNDGVKTQIKSAELEIREEISREDVRTFKYYDWLIYLVYRIIKTFYDCIYYYFLPFSIVLITFLTSNSIAMREAELAAELKQ